MTMRRLLYSPILALVLLLLECSTSAAAEPPPLPRRPPPTKAEQDLQEQAKRLVHDGRIADARDVHLTLWHLTKSASDAFNVGMLSFRLREFATAAEFLTVYFDMVGTPDAPKIWVPPGFKDSYGAARANFAEARRHIGALQINVSDPGAEVSVDGRRVGLSPLKYPVFVWPGQHRVSAQLGGARDEEIVSATADGQHTVRLVLPSTPAPATPPATTPPRAGGARGAPLTAAPASKPNAWVRWLPAGGLAATSVALGIFGGIAVATANSAADERRESLHRVRHESLSGCPGVAACDDFTAADGRAKTWTTLAVGGFVAAGLAAAGAATVYGFTPSNPVRGGLAPSGALIAVW
jgi:hypothetical protein